MRFAIYGLIALAFLPLPADAGIFDNILHKPAPREHDLPMTYITQGNSASYSPAADRIVFSRYDLSIKGAPSIDGKTAATGTFELWTADPDGAGERCISCFDIAGGPKRGQHKGAPDWHPSGRWIVASVEMPQHQDTHDRTTPGRGAFMDLWVVSANGKQWYQLTHYASAASGPRFENAPTGALMPHFSHSGGKLAWAEMIGADADHPYGIWQLAIADFTFGPHGAELKNKQVFRPGLKDATFFEPWSFSPDDATMLVASDNGAGNPAYMQLQEWDVKNNTLMPITRTHNQYTEEGFYSPGGRRIAYMTTVDQEPPYNPRPGQFLKTFRTDVWLMRANGTDPQRLTYVNAPDHDHYRPGQYFVIPVGWMNGRTLLFDIDPIIGGRQAWENNAIYRLDLP